MKPMTTRKVAVVTLALLAAACGSTPPPKELVSARAAYDKAQAGKAKEANPAALHVAKESLEDAERAFQDDPSAQETKDKAYVADLKAQMADSQANAMLAEQDRNQAQVDLGQKTQAELRSTREQLASERQRSQMTQQQLEQERKAREEAEKRAKEALENLAKMAQVKQETRGMVITLSGAVLFASGQSELLPAAMASLDNVVTALKANPDRSVTVEGHTDSQGARAFNMDLSQRRADSVRSFLVSRGIPSEVIRGVGIGPDRPVADNKTAEGRANNRRVEIVVSPAERK
jgi:outer membrane protein OmpA-like peptidoglycan-associated protein